MAAIVAIERRRKGNSRLHQFWGLPYAEQDSMESVGDKGTEESVVRTKVRGLICREIEKDGMLKCLGG